MGKYKKRYCLCDSIHIISIKYPQSCKNLIQIFDMEQKVSLKGLKFVNLNLPIKSSIHEIIVLMR